ncbi:hypothetical protein ACS0TY_031287 [Phlomoides rotata]
MVEDLDAKVEAEINEECTENNNEGKNIENDDVRGSLLGITREISEMMYELYCQHAHEIGFSVRKSSTRYSCKDHIELSKITNCKAMMRTKRNKEGLFEVVRHEIEHNHPLTRT